jgi:hypothetical protein
MRKKMNRSNLYYKKSDRNRMCGSTACLWKHDKNIALDIFVQVFDLSEDYLVFARHKIRETHYLTRQRFIEVFSRLAILNILLECEL